MNPRSSILFLFLLFFQSVVAGPEKTEVLGYKWKYVVFTCNAAISDYTFGTDIESYYPKLCGYEPIVGSVLNCMANELGDGTKNFNKSIARFTKTCGNYGDANYTVTDLLDIYENATNYMIDLDTVTSNLTETIFYQPINITHEVIADGLGYYEYLYFNFDKASMLAGMMYLYFVLVFIIIGTTNFIKRLGYHRRFNNKFINWYRANVSIPALFNGKHTEAPVALKIFSTLIPTRVESIVIFFFICLNILLTTVHYSFKSQEYPSAVELMEFLADRTGLLSFGLIPLLIIFAGRNNILTSLTGIPFSTFIVFHKWVARFMWIHALIHSAAWTAYAVYYDYLASYSADGYWRWGIFATIIGGLILVQAFHVFRTMAYETFVILHIIMAIGFIVGCWWHCYSLGWLEWIYVSWAVWIFDRVMRGIKMCMFGFRDAHIELSMGDTFKLTVKHGKWFQPFPGAYGYVYFITPTTFWQSHPFTIVDSVLNEDETIIYIKTKKGITNKLNKQLTKIPGNKKTIKISIEGPYGHRAPMEKYDTALFLAGGNGIPGPFYHAVELAKRESSSKQQIKLNWVLRNPDSLQWFHEELKMLANLPVQTNVYITAPQNKDQLEIISDEKKESSSTSDDQSNEDDVKIASETEKSTSNTEIIDSLSSHIQFHYGRPNIEDIIVKDFTDETGPSVAVMSCGPSKMVDIIRCLVAKHLQKSKGRIDLYEELQVW